MNRSNIGLGYYLPTFLFCETHCSPQETDDDDDDDDDDEWTVLI